MKIAKETRLYAIKTINAFAMIASKLMTDRKDVSIDLFVVCMIALGISPLEIIEAEGLTLDKDLFQRCSDELVKLRDYENGKQAGVN